MLSEQFLKDVGLCIPAHYLSVAGSTNDSETSEIREKSFHQSKAERSKHAAVLYKSPAPLPPCLAHKVSNC